jgi:hypothetical protein
MLIHFFRFSTSEIRFFIIEQTFDKADRESVIVYLLKNLFSSRFGWGEKAFFSRGSAGKYFVEGILGGHEKIGFVC